MVTSLTFAQYITDIHHKFGGILKTYIFPNGYGASVVSHQYSYGGDEALWEMALLDAKTNSLIYEQDFDDDVKGWLTTQNVQEWLEKISNYPPR